MKYEIGDRVKHAGFKNTFGMVFQTFSNLISTSIDCQKSQIVVIQWDDPVNVPLASKLEVVTSDRLEFVERPSLTFAISNAQNSFTVSDYNPCMLHEKRIIDSKVLS